MTTERHFAWFTVATRAWIGEWRGRVPAPTVPSHLIGDARLQRLNKWQQQIQSVITPAGSPYPMVQQVWNLEAWHDCPPGGAVCLDVTQFEYPVGDFRWMRFDDVDRLLDWPDSHKFIQIDRATMTIVVNSESARPILSTPERLVIDITGTPLEAFYGHLFGQLVRHDHHWTLAPLRDDALVPVATQRALEAARIDLELVTASPRVLVHV